MPAAGQEGGRFILSEHHRADIQGLRALAVTLVVLYHAGFSFVPGGYVGVDVFFVISGYLITGLLLREVEQTGSVAIAPFYARRMRRLIPAATLVVLATLVFASFIYSPLELRPAAAAALASATYVSNFWFARQATDYLAEGADANPFLHTWSLSVEEQFFAVWPLLVVALTKAGPPERRRARLVTGLACLSVVSLVASVVITERNQPWAFFGAPTRAWEFGAGGLIALWASASSLGPRARSLAGWAGAALIAGAALFYGEGTSYPGSAAVVPVLGAALIIAAAHRAPVTGFGRWLSVPPLQHIGALSYAMYLWHWPAFLFLGLRAEGTTTAARVLAIVAVGAVSWLTVVLIENPVRFSRVLIPRVAASIGLGLALSGGTAAAALSMWAVARSGNEDLAQQRYAAASTDVPVLYSNGCHAGMLETVAKECVFGDTASDVTVVLFGDSHAAQWLPALEVVSQREGWRLVSLTKSGCPAAAVPTYVERLKRAYVECDEWRRQSLARVAALRPGLVVVGSSRQALATSLSGADATAAWLEGTKQTRASLESHAGAVVFMRDTPILPFHAPNCLSRAAWHGKDAARACTFALPGPQGDTLSEVDRAQLAGFSGAVVDMTDTICPQAPCVVDRDGLVVFSDFSHLTASFSRHLADALQQRLRLIRGMTK